MIARNDRSRLVEKWIGHISAGDALVCEPSDCVVVFKWGSIQGVFGAGRHAMPEGEVEVYFVSVVAHDGLRAGGPAGSILDAATNIDVTVRAMVEYSLRVADPSVCVANFIGNAAQSDEPIRAWVSAQVLNAIKHVVAKPQPVLALIANPMSIAGTVLDVANQSLAGTGLEITQLGSLVLSVPPSEYESLRRR